MFKSWIDGWFESHIETMFIKRGGKTFFRVGWFSGEHDVTALTIQRDQIRTQLKRMFWVGSAFGLVWGALGPAFIGAIFPAWVAENYLLEVWSVFTLIGFVSYLHFSMQDMRVKILKK